MKSNLLFIVSILFIISIAFVSKHNGEYEWLNWVLYIGYGVVAVYTAPDWVINIARKLAEAILVIMVLFGMFVLALFIVPYLLFEKKKCKETQEYHHGEG